MTVMTMPEDCSITPNPLERVLNFRDLGCTINKLCSKETATKLKTGRLFRSARPDEATVKDRRALTTTYGLRTIIDLRSKTEHLEQARKFDDSIRSTALLSTNDQAATSREKLPGVNYININLNGGAFSRALLWQLRWLSLFKLLGLMAVGYRTEAISVLGREVMAPRGLVGLGQDSLDYCQAEIRQVFEVLAMPANYPVLVHCTQGKDRTGLIILLVLFLLDSPTEAATIDYRASERELEVERQSRLAEIKSIGLGEDFAGCPVDFVAKMKQYIEGKYGGIQSYLETCGVNSSMRRDIRATLASEKLHDP